MAKYIVFKASDREFVIPLDEIKEVVPFFEINKAPLMPEGYCGLINLRGEILSVLDFNMRMGLGAITIVRKKSCILVFEDRELKVGIVVESVGEIIDLSDEKIHKIPKDQERLFLDGVIRQENRTYYKLKTDEFLNFEKIRQGRKSA